MGESIKAVCIVLLFICGIMAAVSWSMDRPDTFNSVSRIVSPLVCVAAIAVFLLVHFRRDKVPDYLYRVAKNYFDRDGFCFVVDTFSKDGVCFARAHFQNRRDSQCLGQIALRPAKGFISRAKIEAIGFEIECPPAGFGVAEVPFPIGMDYQGKKQKFEVGAAVSHPSGKGRMLRYRTGMNIRQNTEFESGFVTGLQVAGALTGHIILSKPATVTVILPKFVAEEVPEDFRPMVQILWQLGDPTDATPVSAVRANEVV